MVKTNARYVNEIGETLANNFYYFSDTTEEANGWQILPDVLLEQIFSLLTLKEKHIASQVCRHWFRIFYSPKVWSLFVLNDTTLTKRKYNYYLGYQRILDHYRTQVCQTSLICAQHSGAQ